MKKSVHQNITTKPSRAILIIDKVGLIGERLSEQYAKDYFVIFITNRVFQNNHRNITRLRFKNKIPKAPRNDYLKILIIDNGEKEVKSYTNSIIKEIKNFETDIYFLINTRSSNIKLSEIFINKYQRLKVLVIGDIFDDNVYFEKESTITQFIKSVRKNKKIVIRNEGLGASFPITLEDTIKLIIKATFINASQKIILLFYQTAITDMSLAHLFQKIDPDIDVDFKSDTEKFKFSLPERSVYAIKNYNLKNKLEDLNFDTSSNQVTISKPVKKGGHGLIKSFMLLMLLLIFIFLLPYLSTYLYLTIGYQQISSAHKSASSGDFVKAQSKSDNATVLFNFASKSKEIYVYQINLVGLNEFENVFNSKIQNGENISKSMSEFFEGMISFEKISKGESQNNKEELDRGTAALSNSYSIFQKLDIRDKNQFEKYIKNTYPFIEMVINTKEIIPIVMGEGKEMNYLVLFMDSTELMPGGGSVKAVGELKVRDYQIVNFNIISSKELDEKLSINIEPPFMLRRHAGEKNSLIESSLVNLDFVTNAQSSSNIFKQEAGEDVDGAIGIDLYFLQGLLQITGPIELEEKGYDISSENLFTTISNDDTDEFFEVIVNKIFEEIQIMENSPYYDLFQLFGEMIPKKHLFIALKDAENQRVISSNNLSNSLTELRQKKNYEIFDYLGLYDANLGNNHINFYISRSVERINTIDSDGSFMTDLSITYNNKSGVDGLFSKNYKNYIQLALPLGSSLKEISIGGQKVEIAPAITDPEIYEAKDFLPPQELEVKQSVEKGLSVFGFLVVVPPDSVKNIKISYSLPFNMTDLDGNANYSLKIFKQSGIDSYPFSMSFDSSTYNVIPGEVFSTDLNKDTFVNYLISEK